MPRWHIRYLLSGVNFPIGASCRNRSGAGRVWHTGSKLNPVLFMPGSLPELSSVEVYVIHQMHLADGFFHPATSLAEKKPAFVQSLHKMKPDFLAVKTRISLIFIGDYHFPAGGA